MRFRFGEVPHIPWWRLMNMNRVEIEEFNNKHLVEIEMNDQAGVLLKDFNIIWNAAIEAAANKAEANGTMCVAMEIRKLKK